MDLQQVMAKHSFTVVGDTLTPGKPAKEIKEKLLAHGYAVCAVGKELPSLNDVPQPLEVVDLCIHPAKGLALLTGCTKPIGCVVIQPGAESEEICALLAQRDIPYLKGCLLVGLRLYAGHMGRWDD